MNGPPRPRRIPGRARRAPLSLLGYRLAGLDLDLARLGLFGLGHADLEHAVPVRRLDRVAAHGGAEGEAALERAQVALDPKRGATLLGLLVLALATDGERVADQTDRHILLRQAGQIGPH